VARRGVVCERSTWERELYFCLAKGRHSGTMSCGENKGISIMKMTVIVAAGLVAMLSAAAAADLPRKEPPPPAPPVGKAPIGKYPVGKYPIGKYPQPVVTKG
jgi:hypothetical protein